MRLVTFEAAGARRLGAEWRRGIVDLQNAAALRELVGYGTAAAQALAERFPSDMIGYLAGGPESAAVASGALEWLDNLPGGVIDGLYGSSAVLYRSNQVSLRAPVPRPAKVICVGLNYRDHAAESGLPVPQEPVIFCKYPSAVIGPGDPIQLPPDSAEVDYEAELVFVIGRRCRNIASEDAMGCVAGVTCGHDVSARDYQIRRGGGQWTIGKTWDTFAPMGPVLVTLDEGMDPHSLPIRCIVNGQVLQDSNTSQFIFDIPTVVAYLSRVMTLEPGDCVFTGTPPGVGFARKPPVFLKSGDVAEIQVDGIGTLKNPVA